MKQNISTIQSRAVDKAVGSYHSRALINLAYIFM